MSGAWAGLVVGTADEGDRWRCGGCGRPNPPWSWAMVQLQIADRLPRRQWPLLANTADDSGTGSVTLSHRGADLDRPPGPDRRVKACRFEVATRPVNAISAVGVLNRRSLRVLLDSASRGTLDAGELARIWGLQVRDVPGWVRSDAAAAEFVGLHSGTREPARTGMSR